MKIVLNVTKKPFLIYLLLLLLNSRENFAYIDSGMKSMLPQQILTAVMTCIIVDKNAVHAKPHSIFFYHNIKDNKRNLC